MMTHKIKHMTIKIYEKSYSRICACCKQFDSMASGDGWCSVKDKQVGSLSCCCKFEKVEEIDGV